MRLRIPRCHRLRRKVAGPLVHITHQLMRRHHPETLRERVKQDRSLITEPLRLLPVKSALPLRRDLKMNHRTTDLTTGIPLNLSHTTTFSTDIYTNDRPESANRPTPRCVVTWSQREPGRGQGEG